MKGSLTAPVLVPDPVFMKLKMYPTLLKCPLEKLSEKIWTLKKREFRIAYD